MEDNHQNKIVKSIDDFKEVVLNNIGSYELLESVDNLSTKFSENTE